jgi:Thioredoxin-like
VAAAIAERWAKPLDAKGPSKPRLDPQYDARVDLEKALKGARESKRRVLIEFGGHASPECVKLFEDLTRNAEIATELRNNFALLLVDIDYRDAGRMVLNQYVPKSKQGPSPLLVVMDADENVLDTSDTSALKAGNGYAVERLKAYLAKWSPRK